MDKIEERDGLTYVNGELYDQFAENARIKNAERRARIVDNMNKSRKQSRDYFFQRVFPANAFISKNREP